MQVYIVVYKSEQQDQLIDNVFFDLEEAKGRADLLDETLAHNAHVGIVIKTATRPREWTEEQRRWMRGRS